MDSFKRLFDDEDPVPEHVFRDVEQRINRSVQPARFAGNTADLYIDKVGKTLVAFFGGSPSPKRSRNSAAPTDNDAPPGGEQ